MSTRQKFLTELRAAILERYSGPDKTGLDGWANNPDKLDAFLSVTLRTIEGEKNLVNLKGEAMTAAWRAVGGKGKPTYKGLRALPDHDWKAQAQAGGAEMIEGNGQFRAGRGAVVTDWFNAEVDAWKSFCDLQHGQEAA